MVCNNIVIGDLESEQVKLFKQRIANKYNYGVSYYSKNSVCGNKRKQAVING